MRIESERLQSDDDPGPFELIPITLLTMDTTPSGIELETISLKDQQERIVTALVLLAWMQGMQLVKFPLHTEQIVDLYTMGDFSAAYTESTKVLLALKKEFAVSASEFGIDDKIFLHLNVPGETKADAREIWKHAFEAVFASLHTTDEKFRSDVYFSGLGFREIIPGDPETNLCVIVNAIDWNESFLWHEYLHTLYPGIKNTFFDEMMTESLAYAHCHFLDLETYRLIDKDKLGKNINTDYYDWLAFFLRLCEEHRDLFPFLKTLYETGNDTDLHKVGNIIGKDLFEKLVATEPDTHPE